MNGPVTADGRLELWDATALRTDTHATKGIGAVIYCLGYTRAPLPEVALIGGATATIEGSTPTGQLFTSDGALANMYGAGVAFAEDEMSSGAPYPEAGLSAFTRRAHAIVKNLCGDAKLSTPYH